MLFSLLFFKDGVTKAQRGKGIHPRSHSQKQWRQAVHLHCPIPGPGFLATTLHCQEKLTDVDPELANEVWGPLAGCHEVPNGRLPGEVK